MVYIWSSFGINQEKTRTETIHEKKRNFLTDIKTTSNKDLKI
jgi:hypothetical protein